MGVLQTSILLKVTDSFNYNKKILKPILQKAVIFLSALLFNILTFL